MALGKGIQKTRFSDKKTSVGKRPKKSKLCQKAFNLDTDLVRRLERCVFELKGKEEERVTNSSIVKKALEEYLQKKGF